MHHRMPQEIICSYGSKTSESTYLVLKDGQQRRALLRWLKSELCSAMLSLQITDTLHLLHLIMHMYL